VAPATVRWSGGQARAAAVGGAGASRVAAPSRPLSASLPALAYEIGRVPAR
jgi:hypothetical protein